MSVYWSKILSTSTFLGNLAKLTVNQWINSPLLPALNTAVMFGTGIDLLEFECVWVQMQGCSVAAEEIKHWLDENQEPTHIFGAKKVPYNKPSEENKEKLGTWYANSAHYLLRTWSETYFALKFSIMARLAWSISFWARPRRLWERFTA